MSKNASAILFPLANLIDSDSLVKPVIMALGITSSKMGIAADKNIFLSSTMIMLGASSLSAAAENNVFISVPRH